MPTKSLKLDDVDYSREHSNPLYFSPKTILLYVTILNVILFVGGTVFSGIQVVSIQEKYQEASIKISEAKQKYNEAKQNLDSIGEFEISTKNKLLQIERDAGNLLTNLEEKSDEEYKEVQVIKVKSQKELDLLEVSGAKIITEMNNYRDNTEAELNKLLGQVTLKLTQDIEFNRDEIKRKQKSVQNLEIKINELSLNIKEKSQNISKVEQDIQLQFDKANSLNVKFSNEIEEITKAKVISFSLLWGITDWWIRAVLITFTLLFIILIFRSFSKN